jgi:hypothetical protein
MVTERVALLWPALGQELSLAQAQELSLGQAQE